MAADNAPPSPLTSPYPFAAAPDIIRAHQKDAYFQNTLSNQIFELHRQFLGPHSAHAWMNETSMIGDLLYLGLTTLLGNRTLGEEYCDLVQVENETPLDHVRNLFRSEGRGQAGAQGGPRLPGLLRRAIYIFSAVLLPYGLGRILPRLREQIRHVLEARLTTLLKRNAPLDKRKGRVSTFDSRIAAWEYQLERYIILRLHHLTSGTYLRAVTMAVFYFSGAYYTFAKRLVGLRYVFTRRPQHIGPEDPTGRGGYEVLGAMLVVQLILQAFQHIRMTMSNGAGASNEAAEEAMKLDAWLRQRAYGFDGQNDGDEPNDGASPGTSANGLHVTISAITHTPLPSTSSGARPQNENELDESASPAIARYDLRIGPQIMGWIKGESGRKCTLCLEGMKDPAAMQCGHVFCWTCIGDWIREKPECPLCRREALIQHILPLRAV